MTEQRTANETMSCARWLEECIRDQIKRGLSHRVQITVRTNDLIYRRTLWLKKLLLRILVTRPSIVTHTINPSVALCEAATP